MRKAIMVYGPPGAGKGTQANLLAGKLGLIHFDTGKFIEGEVHSPASQTDPELHALQIAFDSGKLGEPTTVYKIVKSGAEKVAQSGFGIVFSGSPRTMYEAFEAEGDSGLVALLDKWYGRENVYPVHLNVKPETSMHRNGNRLICSICGVPVMYHEHARPEFCPLCGGLFRRRTLDAPEVIKVRLKEYENRTLPIIGRLKKDGYNVIEVDGEPLPYLVFADILKKLGM